VGWRAKCPITGVFPADFSIRSRMCARRFHLLILVQSFPWLKKLKSLTSSVYLPPSPNLFNPQRVLAADKPCWTEPPGSGTYGDCKVLRLVVNSKFGKSCDVRGTNGCSCANFRLSSVPECRAIPQIQAPFPPYGRARPRRLRTADCRVRRIEKQRCFTAAPEVARAASWAGSAASPETPLRRSADSSATRCLPPAA